MMPEFVQEFDFSVLYFLQSLHTPILNATMITFTFLGNIGLIWILMALAALISKKHRALGIRLAMVLIITLIIGCLGLKNLVARDRPCWLDESVIMLINIPKDYSFPSGHTMSSFACAFVIFRYKKFWGSIALVVAALIAFSRMYLFVHFPTDVAAGLLLGVMGAVITELAAVKLLPYLTGRFPGLFTEPAPASSGKNVSANAGLLQETSGQPRTPINE